MAHNQPELLDILLGLLNHPGADVYVHVDERATGLLSVPLRSHQDGLTLLIGRAAWGGFSLVRAELRLLAAALATDGYQYLHLISGQDLPLVPVDTMIERLAGRDEQFVGFVPARDRDAVWKARYWHPFADSRSYRGSLTLKAMRRAATAAQWAMGVNHVKRYGIEPRQGSQWFSITPELASWIVAREDWIEHVFHKAIASDEIFLTTMLATFQPDFNLAQEGNLRWIHWPPTVQGPLTIGRSELPCLPEAAKTCLFARKFDMRTNPDAVDYVLKMLGN